MVYIGTDGKVVSNRSPWRLSIVSDFFWGILNCMGLFFRTLTNPVQPGQRTYAERNKRMSNGTKGGKRANIRGVSNMGTADAPAAGG